MKIIVVTDLDGCLLDPKTYDPGEAAEYIDEVTGSGIEIVFNSSKTRAEQEYYRRVWGLNNVFVSENGAAIYVPRGDDYDVVVKGVERSIIERRLSDLIERTRRQLLWLIDMDPGKFSQITNLPLDVSPLALMREYSTLFHPLTGDRGFVERVLYEIRRRGFIAHTGSGKIYVVTGNHNKGDAVRELRRLFGEMYGEYVLIGVGDGLNDLPMLLETEYGIILGNERLFMELSRIKPREKLVYINGRGPSYWYRGLEIITRRL